MRANHHVKIHKTEGRSAQKELEAIGLDRIVQCNWLVDRDLVGTNQFVADYSWWSQHPTGHVHRHPRDELLFIAEGECYHVGEKLHLHCTKGDLVFVPAGYWHGVWVPDPNKRVEALAIYGGVGSWEEVGYEECPRELALKFLANLPGWTQAAE
jgi:mannose-6-phosphate isomerase-like protein (cupin superfamily)